MQQLLTKLLFMILLTGASGALTAQDASISGRIVLSGEETPLEGIAVFLEGTSFGFITNSKGRFNLSGLPSGDYVLSASSIGFVTEQQALSIAEGEQKDITILLEESVMGLPTAVVSSVSLTGGLSGLREVPGSAHYLSPRTLEKFSYTDINRILRMVPGVNLQEEDGFGLRPNISLRGTGSERTSKITVMEDGVLAAPAPYTAPAAYYFPTAGRMQAVEILKGSSQIRFGPYTTGGAINLISTTIPSEFSGKVYLQAGAYGSRNLHAWAGNSHRNFGYVVETFQQQSTGFKELDNDGPTGFDKKDYLAKLRLNTGPSAAIYQRLTFKTGQTTETSDETYLGLTDADFDQTPYRRYAASQVDRMQAEQQQYSLQHLARFSSKLNLTTTAYYNKFHRNWYKLGKIKENTGQSPGIAAVLESPDTFAEAYGIFTGTTSVLPDALLVKANNRSYRSSGVQSVLNFAPGQSADRHFQHHFTFGLRYHTDRLDRFQWEDAYRMEDGVMELTKAGTPGTESNRLESADAFASWLQYKLKIGQWTFIPGLRHENIRLERLDYGKKDPERTGSSLSRRNNQVDVWIPGLGFTYALKPGMDLFAGVHKGFSPPGSTEGAQPEKSINYELGLRYRKRAFSSQAVLFFNDYDNLLGADLAAGGGSGSGELFNGGAARAKGLELEIAWDLLAASESTLNLPVALSYTYTESKFLTGFDSDFEGWGTVAEGDQIPYQAKHQLALQLGVQQQRFSAWLNTRYQSAMRTMPGQGDIQEQHKIDAYFVLDLSASYQLHPSVQLFATARNLTDNTYAVSRAPAGLRPGLPRLVMGGMKVRF